MDVNSICQAPWDGVVVHFSGAIYACDSMSQGIEMQRMILGDLNELSLSEILNGEKIQKLRGALLSGDVEGFLCQTCNKAGTCNLYGDPEQGQISGEKQQLSIEAPLKLKRLELGLTDLCNMKCTMCCLSRGEASPPFVPKNGMMDIRLAKKVIHEFMDLADEDPLVLLHWVGEPLIYPKFQELLLELSQYSHRLHLVTNGINLSEKGIEQLFSLEGEHTLNVSINAVEDLTYQKINQVDQYARVLGNIDRWLQRREEKDAANWSFLVSSVVLEENYLEIPHFIQFWMEKLERFGGADIGLNGKGNLGSNQIQILAELEKPLSKMYFREALRLAKIEHLEPAIRDWESVDQILLGKEDLDRSKAWVTEQLELLLFGDWTEEEFLYLLQQLEGEQELLTPHLRRFAFVENRVLSSLPFVPKQGSQLLLWMKLVPSAQEQLSGSLHQMEWTEQDVEDLAVLLHWYPSFRHHLSSKLRFPKTKDASWWLVQTALGRGSVMREPPLDWQVEASAGLISQIDHPQLSINIAVALKPSAFAQFLLLAMDTNAQNLEKACLILTEDTPDWLVRAIRRRWFFGGNEKVELCLQLPKRVQFYLLGLMIGEKRSQEKSLMQLRIILQEKRVETIGQDLAEIFLKRPSIGALRGWKPLLQQLWEQLSCPLLHFSSAYILGIAVLLEEAKWKDRKKSSFFLENIQIEQLDIWQQKQWEELISRVKMAEV